MKKITIAIITLGRKSLYKTLSSLFTQKIDRDFEIILILQGTIDTHLLNSINLKSVPVYIYHFNKGLWFWYYRNQALRIATGNVVAFIDDDEWPMDDDWLFNLTIPIFSWNYSVVTSGCYIPRTSSYFTNSISSLGYPGWGSIWFRSLWYVDWKWITKHLCSGNFAINTDIIGVEFCDNAYFWWEDNKLARLLHQKNIQIFYQPTATVYHQPRNLKESIIWWRNRNKSARDLIKNWWLEESIFSKIWRKLFIYFRLDIYLPWRLFLITLQLFLFLLYFNE